MRVATFNLRNYLSTDRWVEGRWRQDYPKPSREVSALREIIRRTEPDILLVQEVGGPDYLTELQKDLKAEGLHYPHAEVLVGPDEHRMLGMLTKLPPKKLISHDKVAFKYFDERIPVKRGMQEAVFVSGDTEWVLFNVHLKSRWTDRKDDPHSQRRRVGEAQALRDLIRERYPSSNEAVRYIIMGDFNDHKDSPVLSRFLTVSDTVLAHFVPCYDSRGENWTFHYRRRDIYERVDFILVSPGMQSFVRGGTGTVVDLLPESKIASDHRMLYVDLDFPDTTSTKE